LIVIDPLNSYLAGLNTSRDGDVRAALSPLVELARKYGFAIVGVVHFNKSGGNRAIYRSLGSIGIQGIARLSWLVAMDPRGGKNTRVMLPVKCNVAKAPKGIAFRLISAKQYRSVPVVVYDAFDIDIAADDALAPPSGTRQTAGDRAVQFLRDQFSTRTAMPSTELFALAGAAGVSRRTVARVLAEAGIEAFKVGRLWAYRRSSSNSPR
jgi:hypothetical protein